MLWIMCLDQALYGLHEPVAIRQAQDACLRKACDRRKLREQPKTARVVTQGTKSACTQVYRCTGPLCTKQGGRSKGRQQAGRLCGTGQEKDAVFVEREAEKNCRTGQHRIGVRKQRQTHVRTSACPHVCPSGPQGPQGDREDGCSSAMQGWPVSSGNKNEALLLLHSFPFSTQPLPCQYVFPDMCGAERRQDMLADLDRGRARRPVLAGQQPGISFLFLSVR